MGKKRKGEKLGDILSELQKLKGEVKSLAKQQAGLAVQIDKLTPKTPSKRPARKPVKAAAKPKAVKPKTATARKGSAAAAPKRPVLVPPPEAKTAAQ